MTLLGQKNPTDGSEQSKRTALLLRKAMEAEVLRGPLEESLKVNSRNLRLLSDAAFI